MCFPYAIRVAMWLSFTDIGWGAAHQLHQQAFTSVPSRLQVRRRIRGKMSPAAAAMPAQQFVPATRLVAGLPGDQLVPVGVADSMRGEITLTTRGCIKLVFMLHQYTVKRAYDRRTEPLLCGLTMF